MRSTSLGAHVVFLILHSGYIVPLSFILLLYSDLYELLISAGFLAFYYLFLPRIFKIDQYLANNDEDKNYLVACVQKYCGQIVLNKPKHDPNDQYLILVHPHGTWCYSSGILSNFYNIININTPPVFVINPIIFKVFLMREFVRAFNYGKCDKKSIVKYIEEKKNVMIYPGGEEELIRSTPGQDIIFIKKRNGIFKLAKEHKLKIIPIICYNETDMYHNYNNIGFRKFIKKITGTAMQFTWGRVFPPWLPRKEFKQLEIVIGEPIDANNFNDFEGIKEEYIKSLYKMHDEYPPSDPTRHFEVL
jgi:hypothetical protein